MQKVKLAEALLRRKELQSKVEQLKDIREKDIFEVKGTRRTVAEGIDDIVAKVPILKASQVTQEYDYYSKHLRLIDAAIQNANWTCELDVHPDSMKSFSDMKEDIKEEVRQELLNKK